MWTKTKSLYLSRILTTAVSAMVVIMTFFVPAIANWYQQLSQGSGFFGDAEIVIPMCVCMYICEVFALAAMYSLHVLLKNISRNEVFTQQNTLCLRRISWSFMLAGCVLFVFGLWRFIFMLAAFLAVMFGLVMRVLKNVFEEAVEIKSENDFTI